MDKIKWRNIANLFRDHTQRLFEDNLIFAFIGGSFAKSKMRKDSDIDMFICLKKINRKKVIIFKRWYLKIHKEHGLRPDKKYFAEVVSIRDLNTAFALINKLKPTFMMQDRKTYDALVWAGLITADHIVFIGEKKAFTDIKRKADRIINFWHKELLKDLKKKLPDEFLKYIIQYKK